MRQTKAKTDATEFRVQDARGIFDSARFLLFLNNELGNEAQKEAEYLDRLAKLMGELWGAANTEITPPPRQVFRDEIQKEAAIGEQLRGYVDEWLDTGVASDGVEDPRERDLTKTRSAGDAVQRFSGKQRLELAVSREGLSVRILDAPNPTVDYLMKNMVDLSSSGDRADQARNEAYGTPQDLADGLFIHCCLSGWALRLAKCKRCSRYFWLKHWNRPYKRGAACSMCIRTRSADSARLSTSKVREQTEQELYKRAARRFRKRIAKQPNWCRDSRVRAEMIGFLNEQIAKSHSLLSVYRRELTGKWLSWSKNRDGIERAAVKGRVHAEG